MEFQGKKATHDFLSLYNKDSSFPLQDSRPPPQGFFLKTHDFLKPLEKAEEPEPSSGRGGCAERTPAAVAHVLPGGIGTYSISHVAGNGSGAAVKSERVTCVPARGPSVERKPEPDCGSAAEYGSYAGVAFTMWDASAATAVAKENGARGQWPSPFAACATTSFAALSSSRNHSGQEKRRLMESGSRSSRGFDEEDEDDDEFGKREGTSKKRELTVKVDGKGGNDQRGAMTPRSKHSATEQRRRSKINDRFQILRELIPHSDQKRDKASFLLEVIEYIQFLQERVQKYESTYPGFNEENAKLMPWVKVFYRSFWKNARNNSHVLGDGTTDPSQLMKNGPGPAFIYSATDDMPAAPAVLSTAQNPIESEMNAGTSYKSLENPVGFASKASASNIPLQPNYGSMERGAAVSHPPQRLISDIDNLASQSQSQWLRPSDYSVSSDVISEQEELTVDEGTINVSTAYSQNILNTLTQALESSGLDLSQANISVQINLGKRATRRATATTTMSSAKDLDDPACGNRPVIGHSRVGSSGEESEQLNKKRKMDNNN